MLVFFSFCFLSLFYCFFSSSYSIVIMLLIFSLLFSLVSCYSPFTGFSFVSQFSSMDPLGVLLVSLSVWVVSLMFLVSYSYTFRGNFSRSFGVVCVSLLLVVSFFFFTDNLLLFYVMFEVSLFPTLLLIVKWGYQPERVQASVYFVMYTICASLPLLFLIVCFFSSNFTFSMSSFFPVSVFCFYSSFSYLALLGWVFAFLVKVPMWGVHLWLPKAHVEAPVSGSMVLAGVLLKLGGYGLMKVCLFLPFYLSGMVDFLFSVNLWGLLAVSLVCLCSSDVKVLIAYSSIVHMGMMVLGIFSGSLLGWLGAGLMMIAHGFSSPGLFSVANFVYEVSGSRHLAFSKGSGFLYPVVSMFWFVLLASNMAAPPSLSLVSEILICVSVLKVGFVLAIFLGLATFLSAAYNLYLYSASQGDVSVFVFPGSFFSSSFMLSSVMHFLPVYLSLFCVSFFLL